MTNTDLIDMLLGSYPNSEPIQDIPDSFSVEWLDRHILVTPDDEPASYSDWLIGVYSQDGWLKGDEPIETLKAMTDTLITTINQLTDRIAARKFAEALTGDPNESPDTENGILTVGELRRRLAGIDDDQHIIVDDADGWYNNIRSVLLPDDNNGISCVTLVPGDPFDGRQF